MLIEFTESWFKNFEDIKKNAPAIYKSAYRKLLELSEYKIVGESIKGYQGLLKVKVWKYRIWYAIINWELLVIWMLKKRAEAYLKRNLDSVYKGIQDEWHKKY